MARSIAEIQAGIVAARAGDATIGDGGTSPLNSTSNVAVWKLWTYIVAFCMYVQESLFDAHKAEVQGIIANQKPHRTQWYATKAKQFQYGYSLPVDSDVYVTIDETAQIVAFAAATEVYPYLRIKVAKSAGGVLGPLASGELVAFTAYMKAVKDAGVFLQCTSGNADSLRLGLSVYYDAQILDNTGARLDGTAATPLKDAVNAFIAALPFDGVFVLNTLIGAMQAVEGVKIAEVNYCAASYGSEPYTVIAAYYRPDAGYMALDGAYFNSNITYTAL